MQNSNVDKAKATEWIINSSGKSSLEDMLSKVSERKPIDSIILSGLERLDMTMECMTEMAYINRATGYKIINNKMRPKQDVLLRIAFALKFGPEETQELLKSGYCALLTASSPRDVVPIYGLKHHLLLEEIDELLIEYGYPGIIPMEK